MDSGSNAPSLHIPILQNFIPMKFTLNWLKESVEFTGTADELAKLLTMAGLEVESVTPLHEPEGDREDQLFEVGVTPNRGDCLGIAGIAREVAALTGARVKSAPVSAARDSSGDPDGKRTRKTGRSRYHSQPSLYAADGG